MEHKIMRYLTFFFAWIFLFNPLAMATWKKINDVDYIWGPFKIYNISLFTETGDYTNDTRPLMLTLKYAKPVEGRDFAISLARSWSNLGITLQNQDDVVDRLRKILPNIRKDDLLSYIALENKGYFVLNNMVIPEEFNKEFSDAVVSVWLDPRVEIGRKLIQREDKKFIANTPHVMSNSSEHLDSEQDKLLDKPQTSPEVKELVVEEKDNHIQQHTEAVRNEENNKLDMKTEPSQEKISPDVEEQEIEISPPLDPIKDTIYPSI